MHSVLRSVSGIVAAAKDGESVVEQEEDEDENEGDADGRSTGAVDGVGLAGGEDEGSGVGGEELDGEEEHDRQEQQPHGAQHLRDEFRHRLALVAEQCRHHHHQHHHRRQYRCVRRAGAPLFDHIGISDFASALVVCVCVFLSF